MNFSNYTIIKVRITRNHFWTIIVTNLWYQNVLNLYSLFIIIHHINENIIKHHFEVNEHSYAEKKCLHFTKKSLLSLALNIFFPFRVHCMQLNFISFIHWLSSYAIAQFLFMPVSSLLNTQVKLQTRLTISE